VSANSVRAYSMGEHICIEGKVVSNDNNLPFPDAVVTTTCIYLSIDQAQMLLASIHEQVSQSIKNKNSDWGHV
jgi:hypothetical protein